MTGKPARIAYDGREYPFITPTLLTFKEATLFKHKAGLGIREIGPALAVLDPEALVCMLVVSGKRMGLTMDYEQVIERMGSISDIEWLPAEGQDETVAPDPLAPSVQATPDAEPTQQPSSPVAAHASTGTLR